MATELATAYVSLVVEASKIAPEVNKQFAGVEKEADRAGKSAGGKFSGSLGKAVKGVGGLIGGLFAAKAVKDFVGGGIEALGIIEKLGAQTDAVIKSTGGAANVTRESLDSLAAGIEKVTSVEAESVTEGANFLLTFKNIKNEAGAGNDVFDQTVRAMTDLSVATGTDAKNAALQLGKALNDPVKGISALSRVGITFTEAQKEQIAALVESGDTMGAQKIILAELESQFGGSAEALGETFPGKLQKLKNSFGEIQETIIGALLPAGERLVEWVAGTALPAIQSFIAEFQNSEGAGGQFRAVLEGIVAVGSGVVDFVTRYKDILIPLGGAILAIVAAMKTWRVITTAVTAVQTALNVVMSANPIGLVVLAIAGLVAALVLAYKNSETFRDIVNGAWSAVKAGVGAVVDWITGTAWPAIQSAWDAIAAGARFLYENFIRPQWLLIRAAISGVVDWLVDTAWPFIKGVWDNIASGATWLYENAIKPAWDKIRAGIDVVVGWLDGTVRPLIASVWDAIGNGATWLWENAIKPAFDFIKGGIDLVVKAFGTAKDAIGRVWGSLKDAVTGPIQTVLSWINSNFIRPLNRLFEALKMSLRIPEINVYGGGASGTSSSGGPMLAFAAGGRVPGYSPNDRADNIPAWLTAGEYVLPVAATRSLRARFGDGFLEALRRGLPGYADGGLVGWLKEKGERAWDWAASAASALSDPAGLISKLVSTVVPGGSMFAKVASGVLPKVVSAVVEKIKAFAASLLASSRAGVDGGSGGPALARVMSAMLPGLKITSTYRDPAHNARVGGRPGSLHTDASNPAVDIGGPTATLDAFYRKLVAMGGWRELLWRVPGHYDHVHAAASGGLVKPFVADSGVTLAPGLNLLHNKLGRPEPLARTDEPQEIYGTLELIDGPNGPLAVIRGVRDFVSNDPVRSRMAGAY